MHGEVLAFSKSVKYITKLVLNEAHLTLLEMEGFEQRRCEDKEEISEGCCGLATGYSALLFTTSTWTFLSTVEPSALFQSSTYA